MARLIACRACGHQVSTQARACPQCGAAPRRIPIWAILVVVVFWIVVIAVVEQDLATGRDRTPAEPPRITMPAPAPAPALAPRPEAPAEAPVTPTATVSAPDEPPVNVTSEQLRRDYDGNEVSADERYRGKVLDVTGIVKAVKKDFRDQPYVELATSNMFQSVHARFAASDAGELKGFKRGDKLIIRCIGNNVVIGSPQLKDCVLQHHYRWRVKSTGDAQ
jgi:hypothetical protein